MHREYLTKEQTQERITAHQRNPKHLTKVQIRKLLAELTITNPPKREGNGYKTNL